MIVLTVDQRRSRRGPDRVDDVLALLRSAAGDRTPVRAFERTAGDEVQGLLDDAALAVDLVLALVRDGGWSTGVGVGAVRRPLPSSARAGAGPANEHARTAVERAKSTPDRVAVVADGDAGQDVDAVLAMLAAVVQRRSAQGWQAVDLVASGLTQTAAAAELGISKQALSQRLSTGLWPQEARLRPVAVAGVAALDPDGPAR